MVRYKVFSEYDFNHQLLPTNKSKTEKLNQNNDSELDILHTVRKQTFPDKIQIFGPYTSLQAHIFTTFDYILENTTQPRRPPTPSPTPPGRIIGEDGYAITATDGIISPGHLAPPAASPKIPHNTRKNPRKKPSKNSRKKPGKKPGKKPRRKTIKKIHRAGVTGDMLEIKIKYTADMLLKSYHANCFGKLGVIFDTATGPVVVPLSNNPYKPICPATSHPPNYRAGLTAESEISNESTWDKIVQLNYEETLLHNSKTSSKRSDKPPRVKQLKLIHFFPTTNIQKTETLPPDQHIIYHRYPQDFIVTDTTGTPVHISQSALPI